MAFYMPKMRGDDDETIESAYYLNKQSKRLPLEINVDKDIFRPLAATDDANQYTMPYITQKRMVNTATMYNRHQSCQFRRPDSGPVTSTSIGPRKHSCKLGNIPGYQR